MSRTFSQDSPREEVTVRSAYYAPLAGQGTDEHEAMLDEDYHTSLGTRQFVHIRTESMSSPKTYIPIDPPTGYPSLDFKPITLSTSVLFIAVIFFGMIFAILTTALVFYRSRPNVFHIQKPVSYVVLGTLPAVIGTITTIWWRSIFQTYNRIIPFISMSRIPTTVLAKDSAHFQTLSAIGQLEYGIGFDFLRLAVTGHFMVVANALTTILVLPFLTSAKNGLINLVEDVDGGWIVKLGILTTGFCAAVYGLLTLCTLAIMIKLWPSYTGLKWDVSPLAAQMSLIQGSNVASAFRNLEYCNRRGMAEHLRTLGHTHGIIRLGYWQNKTDTTDIRYGVRFLKLGEGTTPISVDGPDTKDYIDYPVLEENSTTPCSHEECPLNNGSNIHYPERARYQLAFINVSDVFLLIAFLFDLVLLTMCVLALAKGRLKPGAHFATLVTSDLKSTGAGFLKGLFVRVFYTSGVGVLFGLFSMVSSGADLFYRRMQPFAGMALPKRANENVLLDYIGPNGVQVLLTSITNKHWRVACFSIMVVFQPFTPIFASRAFVFVNEGDIIKVKGVAAWFYVCMAILVFYLFIIVYARPPWYYRTPRFYTSILDLISFCAESRILDGSEFNIQDPTDEELHFFSRIYLEKNRYLFGFYLGKDGRRHLGFDVSQRKIGDRMVYVDMVDPGNRPRIVRVDESLMREADAVPHLEPLSLSKFQRLLRKGSSATPRDSDNEGHPSAESSAYEMQAVQHTDGALLSRPRRMDTEARLG